MLVDAKSVSRTVDAVAEALFEGRKISAADRKRVGRWLAARQGQPGAYGDTFAGFPAERESGIVVFTGERFTSASARHILGEETCRALRLLRLRDSVVEAAIERASTGLDRCLLRASLDPRNTNPGRYCCGKCTVGLWRHLLAGGLDRQQERLTKGLVHLASMRDGEGQWRAYPFWYTVLALCEMDLPQAKKELAYAAALLDRALRRSPGSTIHARRRHELARRALG
jgi:hypothetical protein